MSLRFLPPRQFLVIGVAVLTVLSLYRYSELSLKGPSTTMMSWLSSHLTKNHGDHDAPQHDYTGPTMGPICDVPYISGPEFARIAHGDIRFCAQAILPDDETDESVLTALTETDRNADVSEGVATGPVRGPSGHSEKRTWRPGRTLRVLFLGGSSHVRSKVKEYASIWTQHANIHFEFVSREPADIRVSFKHGKGSWSFVGTDNALVPQDEPTMNFSWLNAQSSDEEIKSITLHEFGHALGLVHMFDHANSKIEWFSDVVYVKYAESQEWMREIVNREVLDHYKVEDSSSTPEALSIMEYPIPKEFTKNGFEVPLNKDLSAADIALIGSLYPQSA